MVGVFGHDSVLSNTHPFLHPNSVGKKYMKITPADKYFFETKKVVAIFNS